MEPRETNPSPAAFVVPSVRVSIDPMRRIIIRLCPLIAVIALIVAACARSSGDKPPAAVSGALLPASATALPAFTPQQFQILLRQLRGTPVVVNVWASWCGPCIAEAPGLAALSKQYLGRVQFVGIDVQDQVGPARAFIRRFGWTYPSVADPTGAVRNSLGLVGQPVTLVYDRSGRRVFVGPGPVSRQTLASQLSKLG